MKLYRTSEASIVEHENNFYSLPNLTWDELLCHPDLLEAARAATKNTSIAFDPYTALAPIVSQEVWAAGVTYYRSRSARIEESKEAGGGTFYDRVYSAARPELFYKSTGWRVSGPGAPVRIRTDATWSVPEPELTLAINPAGKIIGYTIGNDMSSRDIEGENPLYLPQAKVYDASCALGPCILLAESPIPTTTQISIHIDRDAKTVFSGSTSLAELKRTPEHLVEYLFSNQTFPHGVFLMTGTGVVPNDDFTLASADIISISIEGIGTLINHVA